MCVVALIETVRPTDIQVGQMWDQNSKGGGGVAFRAEEAGRKIVKWLKGLSREEMVAQNKLLPFPYILHFRQPSIDTSDSILATHPFVVDAQATSELEGTTTDWLLFHNGHWNDWRKKIEALMLASGGKIKGPSGAWSDTRALALAAYHMGFVFLEMVNEKVMCLGPEKGDIEMFGGPWLQVKVPGTEQTFVVSNRTWESQRILNTVTDTSRLLADAQRSQIGKAGGTSQHTSFPCSHERTTGDVGTQGTQQEQVQEADSQAGTGHGQQARERISTLSSHWDGSRTCYRCQKSTRTGQIILRQWHCFQCWSELQPKLDHVQTVLSEALWVGTCARCRIGSSGMRTVVGNEWICRACWDTNGKPSTYYAREHNIKTA